VFGVLLVHRQCQHLLPQTVPDGIGGLGAALELHGQEQKLVLVQEPSGGIEQLCHCVELWLTSVLLGKL